MKVAGQLKEPVLDPCPNRDDLVTLVDDACQPVECTRDKTARAQGTDCCQFWVPEKFKYEQYRYQLYAKPLDFDCHSTVAKQESIRDREYIPPLTDVRALRQTSMVPVIPGAGVGAGGGIPVVPSNPGGVPEVTFPMTAETLGQPDVTTACCVPVVPCQQGFKNLTPDILPGPNTRCIEPPPPGRKFKQLGPQRPEPCKETTQDGQATYGAHFGVTPQQMYMMPPSNNQACGCSGFPPAFPQTPQMQQRNGAVAPTPNAALINAPQPIGMSQSGPAPQANKQACTNVSTFRYRDRISREYESVKESEHDRRQRITRMSGAYGSALQPKQNSRRNLAGPKDNIKTQGNGFSWGGYPKHENRLCYVLERNQRC